jgi:hypothetical protein
LSDHNPPNPQPVAAQRRSLTFEATLKVTPS